MDQTSFHKSFFKLHDSTFPDQLVLQTTGHHILPTKITSQKIIFLNCLFFDIRLKISDEKLSLFFFFWPGRFATLS